MGYRDETKVVQIGKRQIGGGNPILIQSMCNTKTEDVKATVEQILALEPDVLLMSTMAQTEEQVAALEAAGVRVIVSDAQDIAGVYDAITLIGEVESAFSVHFSMKQVMQLQNVGELADAIEELLG